MENYEYIGDLGSGSYGYVWKCLQRSTGRIVAVKGFKLAHTDKKFLDQAIREVRMLRASCNHPNVVQLLEAFRSSSGRVYMVFEYVDRCLSTELHKRFTCGLPAANTRLVLWQLLCAVAHLHSKKIIHRDIKPGNLLVTAEGVLKLCDFGFARTTRGEPYQPDRFSSYVVTRWYRSPEMLVSDLYSAASDVWSLGCTFAEIATGRPLFPGTSSLDQLWRIMRCLGSLPPSQAERFAAAATAAGLPEPPPPPPRGKSLWQRLPEVETRLLDVVQACLRLDPAQRPTAVQLLQMPYFSEIPKLIVGTPLEKLYGEHGAALNGRTATVSGRSGNQPESQQQQQPSRGGTAATPPPPASSASALAAATATATADRNIVNIGEGGDCGGGGGGTRRSASVLLSTVAASLLGELPAPPGGNGSVQLVPLMATPPAPPQGVDVGSALSTVTGSATATAASVSASAAASAAASHRSNGTAKVLSLASVSFKKAAGVRLSGNPGQSTSPSALSPQPPTATRGHSSSTSSASPQVLPPLSKQPSRRLVSMTPMPPTAAVAAAASAYPPMQAMPTDMAASDTLMHGSAGSETGVAALVRGRSSSCEGAVERPTSRPGTGKRPMGSKDAMSPSESGHEFITGRRGRPAAAAGVSSRAQSRFELLNSQDRPTTAASKESLLGDDDGASIDPQVGFAGAVNAGLGLLPDGADDVLSDGDGQISDDDELLEYFAAKSAAGSGTAAAGGVSRRAMTMPNKLIRSDVQQSSTAGAGDGAAAAIASGATAAAAASGGAVTSSVSLRRMPVDALHSGVQGVHHALYGSRQVSNGSSSLSAATNANRRVATMVMRTADIIAGSSGGAIGTGAAAGGDVGAVQQGPPLRHAKRATVGSYLVMPSQLPAASGELPTDATSRAMAAAIRIRTGAFPGAVGMDEALYRGAGPGPGIGAGAGVGVGPGGSAQAQSALHGGLPALHTHNAPHVMTTTTGTGLAPSSSMPYTTSNYGRTSVPTGGYIITGAQCTGSASVVGSGRRRAISRQVSVVFNQLMYDALPEIGTPGGAPDVPAGTPPRRRVVMSGFTPCRTAAARAAAEGIPPAAAMAAVLGEALQSTTTDISVACSPIHRSVDLLSPDRESEPHCDITAAAAAAVVALRRQHRRQASLASLHETAAATNSSSVGGAVTVAGNSASTAVATSASYHTYQAANLNGDSGLVLGSSAPTINNHRMQRSQEQVPAVILSGTAATPVVIGAGRSPFQLMASTGNAGSVSAVSPSPSIGPTYGTTSASGTRVFQQAPIAPAARSRLASGNMARDSQGASSHIVREGDIESQSAELDPLGAWVGSSCSPAVATTAAAGVGLSPSQPPVQPSTALAFNGLPPTNRGRLGRWVSGLIDSLPEDREVLHVAYGDWRGSYNDGSVEPGGGCDDAIQMLGADGSADWVAMASAAGVLGSGGGGAGNGAMASASQLNLPRGSAGPWPPGACPRTTHSGSGVDPRGDGAAAAAAATASIPPPPPAGSPRMPSGRSRRNFVMAATPQSLLSDVTVTAAAITPSATLPASASQPLSRTSSSPGAERTRQSVPLAAEVPKRRERHASSGGDRAHGSIGGGSVGGGKSIGKWPRAKAFLSGRLLSSLVRKFKDQSSEK
ncbi:hypothetical protein VaNZ11_003439 [Volvox africanus]|uniref:Protein kinase domain-containing protein n=1 Tax=Volvox africanus TaxID=51714 RepID=A0ABQ5RU73_9CHLO|nr:hypothetical protein VaNZ11_003439 [Volvox africanus]